MAANHPIHDIRKSRLLTQKRSQMQTMNVAADNFRASRVVTQSAYLALGLR